MAVFFMEMVFYGAKDTKKPRFAASLQGVVWFYVPKEIIPVPSWL
jgi:hypothetical protein